MDIRRPKARPRSHQRGRHAALPLGESLPLRCAQGRSQRGGLQHEDRYSIAYFLRAENNVRFVDSLGRSVSAKAWHDEKFDVFRETREEQDKYDILTGGGGIERREEIIG